MTQEYFDHSLAELLPYVHEEYKILLAVSGGIDSMCMAYLFLNSRYKNKIEIGHVNFKMRDEDSDMDQKLVGDWALQHDIPFLTVSYDTYAYAKERSISTQMAARELRYNWFDGLVKEHSYDFVAIAHNSDDSVETLFLNLLRGTGLRGLMGIKKRNGYIIRPLSPFMRSEIEEYVGKYNIPYRDDMTNFESHYSRNKIRNLVFPELSKINPSFISTIYRNIERFTEGYVLLDDLYEKMNGKLYEKYPDKFIVRLDILKEEKSVEYWLYRMLSDYGFNAFQLNQMEVLIMAGVQPGKIFRSPSHTLLFDRDKIIVTKMKELDSSLYISEPGLYYFNGQEFKVDLFLKPSDFKPIPHPGQLYIDAEKVRFPLHCRQWQPADRFRPFGMKGFKKLSDFFIDLKLDKFEKDHQIIITHQKDEREEIICIAAQRIDDRYKITRKTTIVMEITLIGDCPL